MGRLARRAVFAGILAGCTAIAAVGFAQPSQARAQVIISGHFDLSPHWHSGGYWHRPWHYDGPRHYYRPYGYYPYRPHHWHSLGPILEFDLFPSTAAPYARPPVRGIFDGNYRRALTAPIGEPIEWYDGRTSGRVTTTRDGWAGDRYCREFRQQVTIDGRTEEAYGTACRASDGDWQLVPNQR